MKKPRKLKRWLIGITLLIGMFVLWLPMSYMRGWITAHIDVARGHYKILAYGLPVPWRSSDASLLKQNYRIEMHTVAGCVVSFTLMEYVHGYNAVSIQAAEDKFGPDVFTKTSETARLQWESSHPDKAN